MRPPGPGAPGWYVEADHPSRMRHWNGRGWDQRSRPRPPWVSGTMVWVAPPPPGPDRPVTDGPVAAAALPAVATAGALGATARSSSARAAHAAGSGLTRRRGDGPSGDGTAGIEVRGIAPRTGPWPMVALSVAVAALIAVFAGMVGDTRSGVTNQQVSADTVFVRDANVACASAMGAARLWPTHAGAPLPTPAAVVAANTRLGELSGRILALPLVSADRSEIQGWLDGWQRFATDRLRAASADGATSSLAAAVGLDATRADAFALTNSLGDCTLNAQPAPGVQSF